VVKGKNSRIGNCGGWAVVKDKLLVTGIARDGHWAMGGLE
jgi:hypothetical protein